MSAKSQPGEAGQSVALHEWDEPMTDAQLAKLAEMLRDPAKLAQALSPEEHERYRRAQESVVRARHEAGREGREVWL